MNFRNKLAVPAMLFALALAAAEKRPAELDVNYRTMPDLCPAELKGKLEKHLEPVRGNNPFPRTEIKWDGDSPVICCNGKELAPVIRYYLGRRIDLPPERLLSAHGVEIFKIGLGCDKRTAGQVIDSFKKNAEQLMRVNPEAKIMLNLWITFPDSRYDKEYPDSFLMRPDGTTEWKGKTHYRHKHWPNYLYSWQEYTGRFLRELFDGIAETEYASRVIGVNIGAMNTGEWWYPKNYEFLWDYSPERKAVFKKYLQTKYAGNTDYLRKLWGAEEDEELYRLPTLVERKLFPVTADSRNANYLEVLNIPVTHAAIYFAKVLKAATGGRILAGMEIHSMLHIMNCNGTVFLRPLLECPELDFLAGPADYQPRRLGHYATARNTSGSFLLNKKLFLQEEDIRTHHAYGSHQGRAGQPTITPDQTRQIMRRQFNSAFMHHRLFYLKDFDLRWHLDSASAEECARAALLYGLMRKEGLRRHSDVAFVADQESQLFSVYFSTPTLMYELVMPFTGVEFDFFELTDFLKPGIADRYKMVVFGGIRALTEKERQGIKKLKKDGRMLVFLHDPGAEDLSYIGRNQSELMSELTGIKLNFMEHRRSEKPLFDYAALKRHLGIREPIDVGGEDKTQAVALQDMIPPQYAYAGVALARITGDDPSAVVLARDSRKKPVILMKKYQDWTSFYSAASLLPAAVIRALARKAGAHILTMTDENVFAAGPFISLHAKTAGKKSLFLKSNDPVLEIYSGKIYRPKDRKIEFETGFGVTSLFYQGNVKRFADALGKAEAQQRIQFAGFRKKYPSPLCKSNMAKWLSPKRPAKKKKTALFEFVPRAMLVSGPYKKEDLEKILKEAPVPVRPLVDGKMPEYVQLLENVGHLAKPLPNAEKFVPWQAFSAKVWNELAGFGISKGQSGLMAFYLLGEPGKEIEVCYADDSDNLVLMNGKELRNMGKPGLFGRIIKLPSRHNTVLIAAVNHTGQDGFTFKVSNVVKKLLPGAQVGISNQPGDIFTSLYPDGYSEDGEKEKEKEVEFKKGTVIFHYSAVKKILTGKVSTKAKMTEQGIIFSGPDTLYTDKYFNIDPKAEYVIRFTAENRGGPVRILGGFMPWNLRGEYVNSLPGSLTSLTHPANAGDTVLKVKDGTNWKSGKHNLVAFDAKGDFSDFPNRNLSPVGITAVSGSKIILNQPLKKSWPAQTQIREHAYPPGTYMYAASLKLKKDGKSDCRGSLKGISSERIEKGKFWPKTSKARLILLPLGVKTPGQVIIRELALIKLDQEG